MRLDAEYHHQRTIRFKGYDYGQQGAYFITIGTHDRAWPFGKVVEGEMRLSDAGRMVQEVWNKRLCLMNRRGVGSEHDYRDLPF